MSGPNPNYKDAIGLSSGGTSSFVVERGKIMEFAVACLEDSPIYRDPEEAKAAGLPDVPVPITFPMSSGLQAKPSGNPGGIMQIINSGLVERKYILHGEQEFEYYRPLVPGERLHGKDKGVTDAYRRETDNGRTMTFFVTETEYSGDDGQPACAMRMIILENYPAPKAP